MKAYCEKSGTRISTGSFYRELARLVADGLVVTADRAPDADPRRSPYRLSSRGAALFDAWLSGPHRGAMGSHDDEVSTAILFLTHADREAVLKLFRSLQEDLWMRSKILERAREAAIAKRASLEDRGFDSLDLLLARRQKHVAAEIEFLDEMRVAYDAWVGRESTRGVSRAPAAERSTSRKARTQER